MTLGGIMFFDGWERTNALCAVSSADLYSKLDLFNAAMTALVKACDGLNAGNVDTYLDFVCPWQTTFSNDAVFTGVVPVPNGRKLAMAAKRDPGLAVFGLWRCLGLDGPVLWDPFEVNSANDRFGAISDIVNLAKTSFTTVTRKQRGLNAQYVLDGALFSVKELVDAKADILLLGDVIVIQSEELEYCGVVAEIPLPVTVDDEVHFSIKVLKGGGLTNDRRRTIETEDITFRLIEDKLWIGPFFTMSVDFVIRTGALPRPNGALLPSGWAALLPEEDEMPTPPGVKEPEIMEGTFASQMALATKNAQMSMVPAGLGGIKPRECIPGMGHGPLNPPVMEMWSRVPNNIIAPKHVPWTPGSRGGT